MPFNERRFTVVNGGLSCRMLTNCVFSLILCLCGTYLPHNRHKWRYIVAFKTDYKAE